MSTHDVFAMWAVCVVVLLVCIMSQIVSGLGSI